MVETSALKRRLTLFPATNIVIANMIGAGIFTTSGLLLGELHDPVLLLVLWLAGGILALMGALCYGVLGSAMPEAGGEYFYLSRMYHPLPGFLSGWVSFFVGFSAPLAASALGFAEYAARAVPAAFSWAPPHVAMRLVAAAIVLSLTLVHLRGVELGARVQNMLTVGKVLLIICLVGLGFAIGQGSFEHLDVKPAPSAPASWKTIGLSLMWIMFGYSGWNASGYIGSEIVKPGRNLPRSLLLGTGLVTLLYLSLNLLFVYAVPPSELEGVIAVGGLAASNLFGIAGDRLISALIAFALLSSISALVILGPRVYYAMARDGMFFRSVSKLHPRSGVPSTSIWIQCVIAVVMVVSGTFDQILTYMGFCLGIFPLLAVLGIFRTRSAGLGVRRTWWLPFVAVIFALVSLCILILSYFERPIESSIAVGTVLIGIPVYAWFRSNQRKNDGYKLPSFP
jgi:APA family basic amino acid/polyamine antiporter